MVSSVRFHLAVKISYLKYSFSCKVQILKNHSSPFYGKPGNSDTDNSDADNSSNINSSRATNMYYTLKENILITYMIPT